MDRVPVFTPSHWIPRLTPLNDIRAVVFDVYGTLLLGGGPVKEDAALDAELGAILQRHDLPAPGELTSRLTAAANDHHASSGADFPEIDLLHLWSGIIGKDIPFHVFRELEAVRQPQALMPGANEALAELSSLPLGLISNAQADTLPLLEQRLGHQPFAEDLTVLSYHHGVAKPSPSLYAILVSALERRGIPVHTTVLVGNDPHHDILPAKACGFHTVLIAADRSSLRKGDPDEAAAVITDLRQLPGLLNP